jgi:outer membrane protein OmpA-like peptidoglycan-associated protein
MMTISVNEVISHFVLNKWKLPSSGITLLDEAVSKLQKYPRLRVNIKGYTDSTGPAEWNAILSKRRAESVKKYLVDHGISEDRIESVTGMGPADPIADNGTKEGRDKNRRAEVKSVEPLQVPAD